MLEPPSQRSPALNDVHAQARAATPALIALLHAGFILTGVVNTMLGPLLPVLSSKWVLTDTQAGNLFLAQFLGSVLGVTGSSFLNPSRGPRFALVCGLLSMAIGSTAVGLTSWSLGIVPVFTLGVGLGLVIPTTNLLVSELYPRGRAAALNLINFSWGVGALMSPFAVARLERANQSFLLLYTVSMLLILLALGVMPLSPALFCSPAASTSQAAPRRTLWRNWLVPALGATFFLYVGTEASVGGWIASYAKRTMPGASWALTPAFFWASLLAGRAISPLLLRHVAENKLSGAGLALAIFGLLGALSARQTWQLGTSTCLIGFGLSSVFPIAIAAVSHRFAESASRVAGLMFNLAGLGGATLPWLVGFTSTRANSLRIGLLVPLLGAIAMLILNFLLARKTPARSPALQ
jgi:FHS family glucose/mannose:H+ symporter-like MFS transporter